MIKSVQFPKMIAHNHTQYVEDEEATYQNLRLTLLTAQGEFQYYPYFGMQTHKYDFNNGALTEVLKYQIQEQLTFFVPQLLLSRENISFVKNKNTLYINIKATNRLNYQPDTFSIVLTGGEA